MKRTLIVLFIVSVLILSGEAGRARAEVAGREVVYTAGGVKMQGYLAFDRNIEGKRPGVLVVPEWWGLTGYEQRRARMLARLGYVALAVDMYGGGEQAKDPDEASRLSSEVTKNFELEKTRFMAALTFLRKQPVVDGSRVAAIGYCFGGGVVLNMAAHGVDLKGVASFHGSLGAVNNVAPGAVKARVLVFQGRDDKFVGPEKVEAFRREMKKAGADFRIILYPGATHSFTNPEADRYAREFNLPIAYDAKADRESWDALEKFFHRIFRKGSGK
ncbi:MAG: dienelactone hydrolase family protein [Candidatus Sulfobium sp.]